MTERITPTDVRELASEVIEAMDGHAMSTANQRLIRLAEQMEVDEERIDKFKDSHAAWGERYFAVELERDTLAAKVAEYEAVAQALYPLVESDPQLCNHPVVERLERALLGKEDTP
jgi:hypothetical protein